MVYNNFRHLGDRMVLMWEHSSAGSASALQAEGHRFEPCCSHHFGPVVQLVRTLACHARGRGFEPLPGRHFKYAGLAHLVERHLAKVEVASSSLVTRSSEKTFVYKRKSFFVYFYTCPFFTLYSLGEQPLYFAKRREK